jgi:hypothetical protein
VHADARAVTVARRRSFNGATMSVVRQLSVGRPHDRPGSEAFMKVFLRVAALTVAAGVLAACQSLTGAEIDASVVRQVTFGQPDGDGHPHVVALLYQPAGSSGFFSCSGTLLSPTLVLTAGHCTASGGQPNAATWVRNDPVIDPASEIPAYGGDVAAWLADLWTTGTAIPHPSYDDFAGFPNTFDVGVVTLDAPMQVATYGALPDPGLLDGLVARPGPRQRRFTVVGYGMQGLIPAFLKDDWERYAGDTTLINLNSDLTGDSHSAGFTSNPGLGNGSGGSCFGDSGGPLFWQDTNVIGAVVSFGITPCIGVDYQFRMDTATALDFVGGYLQE